MRINLTARSALVAAIATIAAVRLTAAPTATPQIQNGQPPVLAREQILIAGIGLEVASDHATVPRNIATGVDVQIVALGAAGVADPTTAIPADALVEAELRGPAFGAPGTIVAPPGQPLRSEEHTSE